LSISKRIIGKQLIYENYRFSTRWMRVFCSVIWA